MTERSPPQPQPDADVAELHARAAAIKRESHALIRRIEELARQIAVAEAEAASASPDAGPEAEKPRG